jgi:arabinose-5-phosphate isomerase
MSIQNQDIIRIAKEVVQLQAKSVEASLQAINETFAEACFAMYACTGRIVISGIGKSAIIAQKIVATLNSTGTPSVFMHAADAIHGDLGNVQENDVVIILSKSGNTPEIKVLSDLVKKMGNTLVAITAQKDAALAKDAHFVLDAFVEKEACPHNLAPTTSTTVQLVLGDAIAVTLMKMRGFQAQDFAKYHPGGALGKRLYIKVSDVLRKEKPQVEAQSTLQDILLEISSKRLGATAVLENNQIVGIITDGDLRRLLVSSADLTALSAKRATDLMSKNPKTVQADTLLVEALEIFETHNISQLLVEDKHQNYLGILHVHDVLKEGLF